MKEITIPCIGYGIKADWYEETKGSDKVLLILPGYTVAKASSANLAESVTKGTGAAALVLDYSGHGESPFDLQELTPAQNFLEVITAFDWLKEKHPNKKITVLGTSYGSFHATQLTKYREFEKLVLRVPALYEPKTFYTKWQDIEDSHAYRFRTDFSDYRTNPLLARAAAFKGSTLVIIHGEDEICPPNSTQAFVDAFKADVWIAKGLKHSLADATTKQIAEYQARIVDWLND